MSPQSSFSQLTKNDRRKQWKLLKTKHSQVIKAAKLDFDLKLGPALDKYQAEVDKLTKLAAKTNLDTNQVQPVLETVWALRKIVPTYSAKVKTLADPAKKELAGLLQAIEADGEGWEMLASALRKQMPAAATKDERDAAEALLAPLDHVHGISQTIIKHGQVVQPIFVRGNPNPRPKAAALVSEFIEAARLAGAAAHQAANAASQVTAGSNYELFKSRAQALTGSLKRLRAVAQAFHDGWNMDADVMTMAPNIIDAVALNGNYLQILEYCDAALKRIAMLP